MSVYILTSKKNWGKMADCLLAGNAYLGVIKAVDEYHV